MNKAQLVEELAGRFEGNKKQAQHALESIIDVIQRTLVKGEKVAITGFGSFEKIDRAARTARNPATGASVRVKKTSVPKFRPGAELKAVVSGAKKLPKAAAGTAASSRIARAAAKSSAGSATKSAGTRTAKSAAAGGTTKKATTRQTTASEVASKTSAKKATPARSTSASTTAAKKNSAKATTARKTPAKRATKKA